MGTRERYGHSREVMLLPLSPTTPCSSQCPLDGHKSPLSPTQARLLRGHRAQGLEEKHHLQALSPSASGDLWSREAASNTICPACQVGHWRSQSLHVYPSPKQVPRPFKSRRASKSMGRLLAHLHVHAPRLSLEQGYFSLTRVPGARRVGRRRA